MRSTVSNVSKIWVIETDPVLADIIGMTMDLARIGWAPSHAAKRVTIKGIPRTRVSMSRMEKREEPGGRSPKQPIG